MYVSKLLAFCISIFELIDRKHASRIRTSSSSSGALGSQSHLYVNSVWASALYMARISPAVILSIVSFAPAIAVDSPFNNGVKLFNQKRYAEALRYMTDSIKQGRTAGNLYYAALSKFYLTDSAGATTLLREVQSDFPRSAEAANATHYLSNSSAGTHCTRIATTVPRSTAHATATQIGLCASDRQNDVDSLPDQAIIPFRRGSGGHMMVDAQLNGRTMPMIFDTGAECCAFGQNHLDAAGISQKGEFAGYANGVGEQVTIFELKAEITVGNLKRRIPIMVQHRLDVPPLLGQSFFAGYTYAIDNNAGIIRFSKKGSSCSSNSIGYDTIDIPFIISGKNMIVQIEIEGKTLDACFDTGASSVVLSANDAAAIGLTIPPDAGWSQSAGIGGEVLSACFNVRNVKMGPIQKSNFPIRVLLGAVPYPLVGQSFFGDRKFTIDQEHSVIHFSR